MMLTINHGYCICAWVTIDDSQFISVTHLWTLFLLSSRIIKSSQFIHIHGCKSNRTFSRVQAIYYNLMVWVSTNHSARIWNCRPAWEEYLCRFHDRLTIPIHVKNISIDHNTVLPFHIRPYTATNSTQLFLWLTKRGAMVFILNLDNISLKKLFPMMNI